MRVAFVIDGFNLYHSVKAAERDLNAKLRWLDVPRLCQTIVSSSFGRSANLGEIHYCSALAKHLEHRKPDVVARHKTFIAALEAHGVNIHLAKFQKKDRLVTLAETKVQFQPLRKWFRIPLSRVRIKMRLHEEKRTDVTMACIVMELLHQNRADAIAIMSGDTDIIPAIETAKRLYPDVVYHACFPYKRHNREFLNAVSQHNTIGSGLYKSHQFPASVPSASGPIVKPAEW